MRRYWDASALIKAFNDPQLEMLALEPGQVTRPHALAEAFSTMTGNRLGFRLAGNDAAEMIKELTADFQCVELSAEEIHNALAQAQKRGVRGGHVHDLLHAVAAKKSGAKELLTCNIKHFEGLEDGYRNVPV